MRRNSPLDLIVLSLLADERRAFIATELLERNRPLTRPQLKRKLQERFPKIARTLAPWPRRSQYITEICDRSLAGLGLASTVEALVDTITGQVDGRAWFATEVVDNIRPYVQFGFEMSNRLNLSLFASLGYLSGSTGESVKNRASILFDVYRHTEPGKPVKLMSFPSYVRHHNAVPYNHIEGLRSAGLVKLMQSKSIRGSEKKHYHWCSGLKPTEELAQKIHRRPPEKFMRLMDILYNETKRDGCVSLHFKYLAEKSGYAAKAITRTLRILTRSGLAKEVSKNALMEIEITEKGVDYVVTFLEPLTISLNGDHESERSCIAQQKVQEGAESFMRHRLDCIAQVMIRYAEIPKPGYERR